MVKKFLKIPCEEDDCQACESGDPDLSNQPRHVYRKNWADDDALLYPAARVVQGWARSALAREEDGPFATSRAGTAYMDRDQQPEKSDNFVEDGEARGGAHADALDYENDSDEPAQRRLRRVEEQQRRLREMQEALGNEQMALNSSECDTTHRRWDVNFMSQDFFASRFARTSSAPPHGNREDALLSAHEAEAARQINDDSFLEAFFRNTSPFWTPRTHTTPKRVRRRACPPGCEACSRQEMWARLMQGKEVI